MPYATQLFKPAQKPVYKNTILLVEDDRMLRTMMTEQLDQLGYNVIEADHGETAYRLLQEHVQLVDVIILDREMPVMDGLQFIEAIKRHPMLANKITIMSTGYGSAEQISEGVAAGVFYYLVKPVNYTVLESLLSSAVHEAENQKKLAELTRKQSKAFALLTEGDFVIKTIAEVKEMVPLLASCFDQAEKVAPGIDALLTNSIEHGHLGIGGDLKRDLVHRNALAAEINSRAALPENKDKKLVIHYLKTADKQILILKDEGQGFNWQNYWQADQDNATPLQGGIRQARRRFDELTYNQAGNQVIAVSYR